MATEKMLNIVESFNQTNTKEESAYYGNEYRAVAGWWHRPRSNRSGGKSSQCHRAKIWSQNHLQRRTGRRLRHRCYRWSVPGRHTRYLCCLRCRTFWSDWRSKVWQWSQSKSTPWARFAKDETEAWAICQRPTHFYLSFLGAQVSLEARPRGRSGFGVF